MQATSAAWKALWAAGAALEAVAVIDGAEYREISAPVIARATMPDSPAVGNAVSAMCRLSVRTEAELPKSAEVKLRVRLTDGASASEWLPAGTFYISRRARDPLGGVVNLECYDALLRANAPWEPGEEGWPRTMTLAAEQLAALLGLELDPRTTLERGEAYVVEKPEAGETVRDVLGKIAAANGGNWIVTPGERLRLVPVTGAGDEVEVQAVLGELHTGAEARITGLRRVEDGARELIGDESGVVVEAALSEALATALADRLLGAAWRPFELTGAIYDPAAELGDALRYGDGTVGTLCAETATLGPAFRGDLSAPEPGELADEYPYVGTGTQALQALRGAVAALEEASVSQVRVEYAQGESATVPPTEGWSAVAQDRVAGMTTWQRTVTLYASGQTRVSEPVNISGADGEPASVLRIDSSRGTVFKNNQVATTLSVVIHRGGDRVTDGAGLRRVFGAGAYLQWSWQRMDENRFGVISADDARIGDEGFSLRLSAADVDTKVTFQCELIV